MRWISSDRGISKWDFELGLLIMGDIHVLLFPKLYEALMVSISSCK